MDGSYHVGTCRKRPVLVVEDNDLVKETVHDLLHELGYTPKSVSNGPEALRHLSEQRYHVALIDLMMYPMDGHELARRAVALQPDLAIIIMTGLEADSLAGYAFPKNTCTLHKPFGVDALQAVIKAAMNVRDQATEIADVS